MPEPALCQLYGLAISAGAKIRLSFVDRRRFCPCHLSRSLRSHHAPAPKASPYVILTTYRLYLYPAGNGAHTGYSETPHDSSCFSSDERYLGSLHPYRSPYISVPPQRHRGSKWCSSTRCRSATASAAYVRFPYHFKHKELKANVMKFCQARLSPHRWASLWPKLRSMPSATICSRHITNMLSVRKFLIDGLNKIPDATPPIPMGAFYTVASLACRRCREFCAWCLEEFSHMRVPL